MSLFQSLELPRPSIVNIRPDASARTEQRRQLLRTLRGCQRWRDIPHAEGLGSGDQFGLPGKENLIDEDLER